MADAVLHLITAWEDTTWTASARSRNELRARAKQLLPPDPPESTTRRDATESMYAAGLRGQRRQP